MSSPIPTPTLSFPSEVEDHTIESTNDLNVTSDGHTTSHAHDQHSDASISGPHVGTQTAQNDPTAHETAPALSEYESSDQNQPSLPSTSNHAGPSTSSSITNNLSSSSNMNPPHNLSLAVDNIYGTDTPSVEGANSESPSPDSEPESPAGTPPPAADHEDPPSDDENEDLNNIIHDAWILYHFTRSSPEPPSGDDNLWNDVVSNGSDSPYR